ncbi:uncharacterized protein BO88DRAFT_427304 [Aspergillus vadensis CBS 113365]|uniref:Uncharacterized protein n=1 Tax=Aspergillus vadensis (strain CBS 113365 / IMI 142717 / IBT 24658) TaxID=1448311 RepID=A0A319B5I8_ASPVC|nr:hypothetical protein BO88DRAFT_427304 [Aspergillus vadensis CBS 113365]PYH67161.1 hypothetical protein BO88DRAFT_427304 [Aspergillus vadensis CBS 113365]
MNSRSPSRTDSVTVSASSLGSIAGQSRYIQMLLEVDHMPWIYNIIASVAHWVLLAGYLKLGKLVQALNDNGANKALLKRIQNPPLLAIACVFFALGAALLTWLCRVFLPVTMNAAAGLATTLINVYTAQSGTWSIMALVTTVMVGSAFFVAADDPKVEEEHEMEMRTSASIDWR